MNDKISPLKAKPLRNPGQSLDEEIDRIVNDKALPYIVAPVMLVFMAAHEWWRWYKQAPYTPWVYTFMAIIAVAIAVKEIYKVRKKVRRLLQGRDGEKAVGQFLESLRKDGHQIFHDVVGEGFNIDHIVIGPRGVFTIETKTYSKPSRKKPVVELVGSKIKLNGQMMSKDPVKQIKAQAGWLKELIHNSTGRDIPVKPVLLFPGWYVEPNNQKSFLILNPKAFRKLIQFEPSQLSAEDVTLISFHLSRYIRSNN